MGYSHLNWKCPFFVWDERLAIHCENGRFKFADREEIKEYTRGFCASDKWKECSIAKSRLRYYERKERQS